MTSIILTIIGLLVSLVFRLVGRGLSWFPGGRGRALRSWQWVLQQVADQRGGTVASGSWRRISCLLPDGEITARIHGSHSHLKVRIRRPLPFAASFYRAPRLLYAFVEAFLKPALRMGQLPYIVVPGPAADKLADLKEAPSFIALLDRFNALGFSIHIDEDGATFSQRVRNRRVEDLPYLEIVTAAEDFAGLCAAPLAKLPMHEVMSQPNCAYCKESILDGSAVAFCGRCNTPHHRECFDLNRGCSVFGCRSQEQVPIPTPIRV
jgi:hypothetical protein